ncbi:RRM-domain-containing protein [Dictyocoela muelleri]|nr:RRM-domain-containing protein [Dictyocoela muelleri]
MELPQKKFSIKVITPFGSKKTTNTTILEGVRFRMPNVKFEEVLKDITPKNNNIYVPPTGAEVSIKISNIPLHLKKIDIYERLKSLNVVIRKLHMVKDRETRNFKGFAYMSVNDMESAKKVIKHLDGTVICSQALLVEIAPDYNK